MWIDKDYEINSAECETSIENKLSSEEVWYYKLSWKIDNIRLDERVDSMKDELSWKTFENWDSFSFFFMKKNWNKVHCKVNVSDTTTLSFGWESYELNLPRNAKITKISFNENKISITLGVAFITRSWEIEYSKILSAIDEALYYWQSNIQAWWNEIKISQKI